jgi:hypothetical protein
VVELDDLDRRQVACSLPGEPLHQHGADREVRSDEDADRRLPPSLVDLEAGRADHDVHAVLDRPCDVLRREARTREIDGDPHLGVDERAEVL